MGLELCSERKLTSRFPKCWFNSFTTLTVNISRPIFIFSLLLAPTFWALGWVDTTELHHFLKKIRLTRATALHYSPAWHKSFNFSTVCPCKVCWSIFLQNDGDFPLSSPFSFPDCLLWWKYKLQPPGPTDTPRWKKYNFQRLNILNFFGFNYVGYDSKKHLQLLLFCWIQYHV